MEKNLIKYDLKKTLKMPIIFYILGIVFAGLTRLCSTFDNIAIINIFKIIFSTIEYAIWGNIIVHTFVQILMRFNLNFYGDESYLTHTLPATKKQLLLSKYVSALITILCSVAALFVCVFIMFFSKQNIAMLKGYLDSISAGLNISPTLFIFLIVFAFFAEICAITSMAFSSIIIGKRFNTKKNLKALLFTFGFYFATVIVTLIIACIVFACMGNLSLLLGNNITGSMMIALLIIAIAMYIIYAVAFYFVSLWQFKKGVNVD